MEKVNLFEGLCQTYKSRSFMQALETLKLLLNLGENLVGKLLIFDALVMEWQTIKLKKHPQCAVCANHS